MLPVGVKAPEDSTTVMVDVALLPLSATLVAIRWNVPSYVGAV
jgi:hypothetical protein